MFNTNIKLKESLVPSKSDCIYMYRLVTSLFYNNNNNKNINNNNNNNNNNINNNNNKYHSVEL
mgnify:CR=1 FL=1